MTNDPHQFHSTATNELSNPGMPLVDTSLRDAAVLVSSLDEADARGLLARLGAVPAGRIRDAMGVLGGVSREERERVLRAFLSERGRPHSPPGAVPSDLAAPQMGGVELDEDLARRFAETSSHQRAGAATFEDDSEQTPFAFLLEMEAEVVAPYLARENPQTVAVVLSYLRRRQAAEILKQFEPDLQAQVLKRLAKLSEIDPACIGVVAEELKAWLARRHDSPQANVSRDGLLRDLLAGGRRHDRDALIAELQREANENVAVAVRSEPVAESVNPQSVFASPDRTAPSKAPVRFEDLVRLGDDELSRTFRTVPRDVLALALAGADDGLIQRITENLSRREAKQLKRSLHLEGPIRLGDIEAAKRRVAEIATEIVRGTSHLSLVICH